jgi:hypothetical protein
MNRLGKKSGMVLAAGTLSLVCVAVSWRLRHAEGQRSASDVQAAHLPDTAASAAPALATVGDLGALDLWKVGTRRTYQAEFQSSLSAGGSAADGAVALRGSVVLALTAQSVDDARVILRAQLSDLVLTAGKGAGKENHIEERVRADLSRPFLVKLRHAGNIESIALDRETKGVGFNILRTLVSALCFVRPDGPNPDWREWTTEESDQNGIFKARYQQIEPGIFRKTKLEYSHVETESRLRLGQNARVTIVATATLRRDRDGVLQSVDGDEHLAVPLGDGSFQSYSRIRVRLKGRDTADVAPLAATTLVETPLFVDRPGIDRVQTDEVARKRALLAGASLPQLMAELERTTPTLQNRDARWKIVERMSALFDLEPERLTEMGTKLRSKLAPDDADMMLGAVSGSKAPEAQSTLAALAGDSSADPRLRNAAAIHLGMQERPTDQTFSNLRKLADEGGDDQTRKSATLALGSAARQAREGGQPSGTSQQAVDYLNNALGGASDPESRRLALEALGNAADPSSLPAIEQALHDKDPMIRRTAVLSLRLYPGADVDALIAGALGDSEHSVRTGALAALMNRSFNGALVTAVAGVIKNDEDPGLRVQAVTLLGRHAGSFPDATAVLEWAKDNDVSPDVRKAALSALQNKLASAKPRPR